MVIDDNITERRDAYAAAARLRITKMSSNCSFIMRVPIHTQVDLVNN